MVGRTGSDKSIKMFRLLFENTFLNAGRTYEEMGEIAGYGRHAIQPWLDYNGSVVEDERAQVWKLNPHGVLTLMRLSGFRKNYSPEERKMVTDYLEQYRNPLEVGDVILDEQTPHSFEFDEVVELGASKVILRGWTVPRGDDLTDASRITQYVHESDWDRALYEYRLPGSKPTPMLGNSALIERIRKSANRKPTEDILAGLEKAYKDIPVSER
ncbi:MAG: hypothetical protein V1820_02455 [archaeon]